MSVGGQILGVVNSRTDDVGDPAEEVGERGGELVTPDEPAVMAKSLLDPIVVEDGQREGCLADSASTDESDWDEPFGEIDYLLGQLVAAEEGPWWQRRRFPRYAGLKCKMMGPSMVEFADLV